MTAHTTTKSIRPIRTIADIEALERHDYRDLVHSRTVYDALIANASLHGERPALTVLNSTDEADVTVAHTHSGLLEAVTRVANLLGNLGVKRHSVVSILARTHARIPELILGAEVAGVANCINYLLSAEVIATLLNAERAEALIVPGPTLDEEIWRKVPEIVKATPSLQVVLVIGSLPDDVEPGLYQSLEERLAEVSATTLQVSVPKAEDRAALFHTGGTTGVPKLVPQTHANQLHAAWCLSQAFDLSEKDVALNGFPLFHVGGASTVGLSVLAAGGHVILLTADGFRNPEVVNNIWQLVERHEATVLGGVPTTIGAIAHVPIEGYDLSTLRFVLTGGAPLSAADAARFEKRTGVPLLEQYGMTETVAAIAATPLHGRHVRGSVGLRGPFTQLAIRRAGSENDAIDCKPGEIGSVLVKGPQIVPGYLDPAHNQEAFTEDGFLITGDLGYLDAEEYLHLTGREKDLIIRSGHNIDPASIEEVANNHPWVRVSAAVGMPDDYAGEVPVLFVVPVDTAHFVAADFQQFMKKNIHEPPAMPRHIFVLDEMPVTGVGKIYKPELRQLASAHKQDTNRQQKTRSNHEN